MGRTINSSRDDEPTGDEGLDDAVDQVVRAVAHAPPQPPPPDPESGTRWGERGRYVIDRRLGRGGMGTVYLATDTLLGRQVALKVLDAEENAEEDARRARLLREARLAAGLEHERVARVYDVGEHDGSTFVAMEYVRGVNLRAWMGEPHGPSEVLAVLTQIAEGLGVLHAGGVIHRDLKPENVMLPAQGGVKLLDFGLAGHITRPAEVVMGAGVTPRMPARGSSAFFGTPGYMAPEQYVGERADARADVFALGVMIVELVTGENPFKGRTMPALFQSVIEEPRRLEGAAWERYPPRLVEVTVQMLQREREDRYADGAQALEALKSVSLAPAVTVDAPPPAKAPHRARRWPWIAGAGVVGLAAAGVVFEPRIARDRELRKVLAAPPPAMAAIDVGRITVGHGADELDRECAQIGPKCNRKKMQREVPSGVVDVPPFFLDMLEITNEELTEVLNIHVAELVVTDDEDDHYPRYVRFNEGLGHGGEPLADLERPGDVEYTAQRTFRTKAGRERLPTSHVTWYGASLYCRTRGKRLPTEDEWEAAARGRTGRPYPWGASPAHCGGAVLSADGMSLMEPGCPETVDARPVGQAPQDVTPEGIRDLGGNVAEWTESTYVEDNRLMHPDKQGIDVPRTIRGGSWAPESSYLARGTGRTGRPGGTAGKNVGFRCARSALATADTR
jgi:formylglycine-generating enzyme required for sulfatase activity/predicted Ser/Thr protein kinase